MKYFFNLLFFVLLAIPGLIFSQIVTDSVAYKGPAEGFSLENNYTNTENFFSSPETEYPRLKLFNKNRPQDYDFAEPGKSPSAPEGSNVIINRSSSKLNKPLTEDTVLVFSSFYGIAQTNSIPPDPYIAVGPEHVVQVVNSRFRITDKEGNTLKTISAGNWYRELLPNVGPFDPKVSYDHFAERWVMVWLHVNDATSESYFLVSVSDDSNPLGEWRNWLIPSNVNGDSPSGNWGDYQGVGFDDKAIYITANQFTFGDNASFDYTKLRIIKKETIYADTSNQAEWLDLWDISYPYGKVGFREYSQFGIRPARMHTASDEFYLAVQSPFGTKNTFGFYKLSDPVTNPKLTGYALPVTEYRIPPNPLQLGGGSPSLDGGSGNLRNEPFYQDGVLYLVHAARYEENFAGTRFLEVDVETDAVINDILFADEPDELGQNYYHTYPAVAVNKKNEVVLTFSRVNANEYIGAFFMILPADIRVPLGTLVLQEGRGNYVVTYSGTRNRWGDYNGAWNDPADSSAFWVFTEYAHDVNTWGTWAAGIRTEAFATPTVIVSAPLLQFDDIEISEKDTAFFSLQNLGDPDLVIDDISFLDGTNFNLIYPETLPLNLSGFQMDSVIVEFEPGEIGVLVDSLILSTNDTSKSRISIGLNGSAYTIAAVQKGDVYASYDADVSTMVSVNLEDATTEIVGPTGAENIKSLTVNPANNELYALAPAPGVTNIVRINADSSDAHIYFSSKVELNAIAFGENSKLYGVTDNQKLYEIEAPSGDTTFIASIPYEVGAISVEPGSNRVWFTRAESRNDSLYFIDTESGETIYAGETGFDSRIYAIQFTLSGVMYGVHYGLLRKSYLFSYDINTGSSNEIGYMGIRSVTGLGFIPDTVTTDVADITVPAKFSLEANYPNPFNPSTTITYSLPANANVKLSLFNVLGEEVKVLVNEDLNAGYHSFKFDAGKKLSSGVYIYKIEAKTAEGKLFTESRKMMLLK